MINWLKSTKRAIVSLQRNNFLTKRYLGTLVSVELNTKIAALTFDDGPHAVWTPRLLDLLHSFNAKATFFMIGKYVEEHRNIVKRAFDENHAIANHSWDHPCFPLVSRYQRIKQIRRCARMIKEYDCGLYRPPYGHQNLASRFDALLCGYDTVCWNLGGSDWKDIQAEDIAEELNNGLHPGSIILLHDAVSKQRHKSREHMLAGLHSFLTANNDYRFVTLPELLKLGNRKEIVWVRKPHIKVSYHS